MSFNQAQQEAVSHNEGPCLVLAGPGSGKTLTIVGRDPEADPDVSCKSGRDSGHHIYQICSSGDEEPPFFSAMKGTRPAVTFGTFHGIYYGNFKVGISVRTGEYSVRGRKNGRCCFRSSTEKRLMNLKRKIS